MAHGKWNKKKRLRFEKKTKIWAFSDIKQKPKSRYSNNGICSILGQQSNEDLLNGFSVNEVKEALVWPKQAIRKMPIFSICISSPHQTPKFYSRNKLVMNKLFDIQEESFGVWCGLYVKIGVVSAEMCLFWPKRVTVVTHNAPQNHEIMEI